MKRVPEPELMNAGDQVLAYATADFDATDQAMVERLALCCGGDPGLRLLDLGCGPGNISFRLARRWPLAQVIGLDGAPRMLAVARERLAALPELHGRLHFAEALLPLPQPLPAGSPLVAGFSAVVSNSLLHHLHDPAVLWQATSTLAAPGAFVYLQDLRRPASAAAVEGLLEARMQGAPEVLRRDYRASLHAAFTVEEVVEQLQHAGLADQLQVQPLEDRYLEVWGVLGAL